jgi:hypothetical protein
MKTDINNINELPFVIRVDDVARIMDISRVAAYNLVHSEGFPCKFIGRRIAVPRDAFFKWLNSNDSCLITD